MELMIDSASVKDIERIQEYIDVDGITTNPSILAKSDLGFKETLDKIVKVMKPNQKLFVQVVSTEYEEMMKEAKFISELPHDNTYVKIPVTKEGLRVIRDCHALGYKTLATAIYTMEQGVLAIRAGADYLAPYVNRMDNTTSSEYEIKGLSEYILRYGHENTIVAASFKNLSQVKTMIALGVEAMTLPIDIIDLMLENLETLHAVDTFKKEFKASFGKESVLID